MDASHRMQDDARGTKGEEGAVLNDATLAGLQFYVAYKGSRIAVVVAERIAQCATLVTRHGDGTVVEVDAGVHRFKSCIDGVALLVASYHIVAHLQGNNLLIVEHVLNDDDAAAGTVGQWLLTISVFFFLCLAELAHPDADTKLLTTLVALEYQRLASLITSLVERDVVIAFWTAYALHGFFLTVNL